MAVEMFHDKNENLHTRICGRHGNSLSTRQPRPLKIVYMCQILGQSFNLDTDKNSAEVDIAPAFGEITTACNVGQAKKGCGACLKSGQLVYARFHPHS